LHHPPPHPASFSQQKARLRYCIAQPRRPLPPARSSAASGIPEAAPRSGMDGSLQKQSNQMSVIIEENKPHKRFKL